MSNRCRIDAKSTPEEGGGGGFEGAVRGACPCGGEGEVDLRVRSGGPVPNTPLTNPDQSVYVFFLFLFLFSSTLGTSHWQVFLVIEKNQ